MNVLIMGAGSIGSVLGGFLAKSGVSVALVGHPELMSAVRDNGLRISGIWGDHHIPSIPAFDKCDDIPAPDFDVVFITVKSYDTAKAARDVLPVVTDKTLVVSLQNGLGNWETVAEVVGPGRLVGGMVIFGARVLEPGHVTVTVYGGPVKFGPYTDAPLDRVEEIARTVDASSIPAKVADDIRAVIWGKVLYNSALNPMSSLLGASYGELAGNDETRRIMALIVEEIFEVASAQGVTLEFADVQAFLDHFYEKLIPPTALHYASMHEDLRTGRRTEIDALNGAIAAYGREAGFSCPVNETLSLLVKARETANAMARKMGV